MADAWSWKAKSGGEPGLLYEPGNWGDLLKAAWVLRVAKWLREVSDSCAYLDMFCGAPSYPRTRLTSIRLQEVDDALLNAALRSFCDDTSWPSAATLARIAFGPEARIRLFEADECRRQRWLSEEGVDVFSPSSPTGWSVLEEASEGELVLVDPYDLLAEHPQHITAMMRTAERSIVLAYIYNRGARGAEAFRLYRDFRNRLEDGWGDRCKLLGRLPADGFLPRAHHEMLLLVPDSVAGRDGLADLLDSLAAVTFRLNQAILDGAVVER